MDDTDRVYLEEDIQPEQRPRKVEDSGPRLGLVGGFGGLLCDLRLVLLGLVAGVLAGPASGASADKLDKDGPTLGEAERNRRQADLVAQDRELQRKRREFQEDLNQRKNEELASVVERANKVVKQIYDTEKFDLILQGDAVIFASSRIDITDKVIKALNAQAAK